jgi:hypothetical protein
MLGEAELPRELLRRLAAEAAELEGIPLQILFGKCQSTYIVRARANFYAKAYREGFSLSQISRFTKKDRTTVRHHLAKLGVMPKGVTYVD